MADHVQATADITVVANHFSAIHSSFQNYFSTHALYKMKWRSCGLLLQTKDRPLTSSLSLCADRELFLFFFLLGQKKDAIDTATLTALLGGLSPERAFFLNAAVS